MSGVVDANPRAVVGLFAGGLGGEEEAGARCNGEVPGASSAGQKVDQVGSPGPSGLIWPQGLVINWRIEEVVGASLLPASAFGSMHRRGMDGVAPWEGAPSSATNLVDPVGCDTGAF